MFKIKIRVIVGVMIFLGYFLVYVVRYNLSVHILEMARIVSRDETSSNTTLFVRLTKNNDMRMLGNYLSILDWDDMKLAKLFSAYHIGYCICFPIFHNVGDSLVGPTWIVGIAGFISGLLNCATPSAAYFDFWVIFAVRMATGFCAGAMQPSMVQVLRHWVPPVERNYFMYAYCGVTTGTFSTLVLCAVVQYYSRWPVGFYTTGGMQVIWAMAWVGVVTDAPRKHSCISKEELAYLTNTIGTIFTIKLMNLKTPWKLIVKSIAFWALVVLNFGYSWIILAMCLHGPLYYSRVIRYTIHDAAFLTALPFLFRFVLGTVAIQVYHWYKQNQQIRRVKHIRKYFIVVSHVVPGLVICCTWMTSMVPGPILLTSALALTAAGMDLTFDLCYEITPNYVNAVNTVIRIIGNTPGIIICYCVGAVTHVYKNDPYAWKQVWCFHAAILLVCGVIFLVWGETEIQPWNSIEHPLRSHRIYRAKPRPSSMSNISEIDEEDNNSIISPTAVGSSTITSFKKALRYTRQSEST